MLMTNGARNDTPLRKTPLFSQLFLCLSRACLGKMFVFMYKWRKQWRFPHQGDRVRALLSQLNLLALPWCQTGSRDWIQM